MSVNCKLTAFSLALLDILLLQYPIATSTSTPCRPAQLTELHHARTSTASRSSHTLRARVSLARLKMEELSTKSHVAVLAEVREAVGRLLKDPLLADLHPEITQGEVNSQLNVLQGRALTLLLRTYNDEIIRELLL